MVPQGPTSLRRSSPQFLKTLYPWLLFHTKRVLPWHLFPRADYFLHWSSNQLHHYIAWCAMAAGDRAICQEANILKTDTNSDTHVCRGDKDQSRSLSIDIFFPKDAVSPGSQGASIFKSWRWPRFWSGTQKCGMQTAHLDVENPWGGDYR